MFEARRARSQRRRSSRSRASIIDWSSARCWGVIERRSDCIAAIRAVSWPTMSSSVFRAREEVAVLAEKLVDLILARLAAFEPFLEEGVEVADHVAVGVELLGRGRLDRPDRPSTKRSSVCFRSFSVKPSNRSRAAGSMKSYSSSCRIRLPTSRGRASSWSIRRAAASRSIARSAASEASGSAGAAADHAPRAAWPPRRGGARSPLVPGRRSRRAPGGRRRGRHGVGTVRNSSRRRRRRSRSSFSPARSGRVGSLVRQPRSISRRRASARSPSAMTSSASASRISSASRAGIVWVPSQRA